MPLRTSLHALLPLSLLLAATVTAQAAPSCPIGNSAIRSAAPNKIYLYFPTADDANFPAQTNCTIGTLACFSGIAVRPLKAFDVSQLPSYHGTVGDLRDAIRDVVTDDYCEFNAQVLETTLAPPTTFPRRVTVGIGADAHVDPSTNLFGVAQEVDTGDGVAIDYARVFAGTYQSTAGGAGGALDGANSTLQRWANSIGGTTAHEAGHTFGLRHYDDFVQNDPSLGCDDGTDQTKPGEDALTRHLMANGCHFTDEQRAGYRRHFSDATFSILASNVGLTLDAIHGWDLVNPNKSSASQLRFEVLSTAASLTLIWSYQASLSPWTAPAVTGPLGTATFKGKTFNRFQVKWSTAKSWSNGAPGVVPAGVAFHVGAAFYGVDFSIADPIIVWKVALLDAAGNPLTLQPRVPSFDAGTLNANTGAFQLAILNVAAPFRPLRIRDLIVTELPRVASIESMVPNARPFSWQDLPITPWSSTQLALCGERGADCTVRLGREPRLLSIAALRQGRHIAHQFNGKCVEPTPGAGGRDTSGYPDVNNCPTEGFSLDLFPSTMVYVIATAVEPNARHWDPSRNAFVVGPLVSRVFYQFPGRHPDLNRNGVDDYIDIATRTSRNASRDGVPDDVRRCAKPLAVLEAAEREERNQTLLVADARRRHVRDERRLQELLRRAEARRQGAFKEFAACEAQQGVQVAGREAAR